MLCFLVTAVTRITVCKDEPTQNVQHLFHFSFSSMKSLSGTLKHLWDVQLSTSDKSSATNTELKEMSHRNLNTFTSFNEWMDLKEQKECSKKGPSGNNFCREKKHHKFHWAAVPEQLYSDMHSAITIQYPSPSSTFLQSSTIDKMSSASSSNLPKPPCCYFLLQPPYSSTGRKQLLLISITQACCTPINLQNKFPNNEMQPFVCLSPQPRFRAASLVN